MEELPWSDVFYKKLKELDLVKLGGKRIFVGSDYSGDDNTCWWTASFVILSMNSLFPDGELLNPRLACLTEPPDYKSFRNKHQIKKVETFLNELDALKGHFFLVGSQAKMNNLSFAENAPINLKSKSVLKANWNKKSFERASRACHLLARYLEAYIECQTIVEWYTDYDQFVETDAHVRDVVSIVNSLRQYYCGSQCGSVLVNHINHEDILLPPKILCKAADLAAGAFNQKIRGSDQVIRNAAYGSSSDIIFSPSSGYRRRYEIIDSWLNANSENMQKVQIVLSEDATGIHFHQVATPSK